MDPVAMGQEGPPEKMREEHPYNGAYGTDNKGGHGGSKGPGERIKLEPATGPPYLQPTYLVASRDPTPWYIQTGTLPVEPSGPHPCDRIWATTSRPDHIGSEYPRVVTSAPTPLR